MSPPSEQEFSAATRRARLPR